MPEQKRQPMDILSKIALKTLVFTKINYKSRGAELGSYSFNLINIGNRLNKANQISELIHEITTTSLLKYTSRYLCIFLRQRLMY